MENLTRILVKKLFDQDLPGVKESVSGFQILLQKADITR